MESDAHTKLSPIPERHASTFDMSRDQSWPVTSSSFYDEIPSLLIGISGSLPDEKAMVACVLTEILDAALTSSYRPAANDSKAKGPLPTSLSEDVSRPRATLVSQDYYRPPVMTIFDQEPEIKADERWVPETPCGSHGKHAVSTLYDWRRLHSDLEAFKAGEDVTWPCSPAVAAIPSDFRPIAAKRDAERFRIRALLMFSKDALSLATALFRDAIHRQAAANQAVGFDGKYFRPVAVCDDEEHVGHNDIATDGGGKGKSKIHHDKDNKPEIPHFPKMRSIFTTRVAIFEGSLLFTEPPNVAFADMREIRRKLQLRAEALAAEGHPLQLELPPMPPPARQQSLFFGCPSHFDVKLFIPLRGPPDGVSGSHGGDDGGGEMHTPSTMNTSSSPPFDPYQDDDEYEVEGDADAEAVEDDDEPEPDAPSSPSLPSSFPIPTPTPDDDDDPLPPNYDPLHAHLLNHPLVRTGAEARIAGVWVRGTPDAGADERGRARYFDAMLVWAVHKVVRELEGLEEGAREEWCRGVRVR